MLVQEMAAETRAAHSSVGGETDLCYRGPSLLTEKPLGEAECFIKEQCGLKTSFESFRNVRAVS